jgi:hypothetical protein
MISIIANGAVGSEIKIIAAKFHQFSSITISWNYHQITSPNYRLIQKIATVERFNKNHSVYDKNDTPLAITKMYLYMLDYVI